MIIYLYKKTHSITGLSYLGKTTQDPMKYKGSGTYWLRHLKTHGNTVTTEILRECSTTDEVTKWGIYYSNLWEVVSSSSWANLKPESGDGGSAGGVNKKIETKRKISKSMLGRTAHNKGEKQPHRPHSPRSDRGVCRGPKPVKQCPHCDRIIDVANYSRYHGNKCKYSTI